jgi:hypothetical protein
MGAKIGFQWQYFYFLFNLLQYVGLMNANKTIPQHDSNFDAYIYILHFEICF